MPIARIGVSSLMPLEPFCAALEADGLHVLDVVASIENTLYAGSVIAVEVESEAYSTTRGHENGGLKNALRRRIGEIKVRVLSEHFATMRQPDEVELVA